MLRRQEERLEREGERHLWVRPLWRRGWGNDGDIPWKDAERERERKVPSRPKREGGFVGRSVWGVCATKNGKYVSLRRQQLWRRGEVGTCFGLSRVI